MSRSPLDPNALYATPFDPAYWRQALADLKSPRVLTFSALMIAACWALGLVPSIQLPMSVKVSWGFLARSLCSMVGGPLNALVFGAAEDTITYLLKPEGAYFPGYLLTTMLGNFTYALFLYRTRLTVTRVFLAKLLTNIQNVVLGSLWSAILYGYGYIATATARLWKNTVMLLPQTLMLVILFAALLPILTQAKLVPPQPDKTRSIPLV